MNLFEEFLDKFIWGKEGLMGFSSPSVSNFLFYSLDELPHLNFELDKAVYFTPALHKTKTNKSSKEDVLGSLMLWVDADDPITPQFILPPTMQIMSGHGHHLYYQLKSPLLDVPSIERGNQILMATIPTADKGCWNANRVLRIPGSTNTKAEPVKVLIEFPYRALTYTLDDLNAIAKLDKSIWPLIQTGQFDKEDFDSRSERDWVVISNLLACGVREDLIRTIFEYGLVGDKVREEFASRTNDSYFNATVLKIKKEAETGSIKGTVTGKKTSKEFTERDDGYYIGDRRLSTFRLKLTMILSPLDRNGQEDVLFMDIEDDTQTIRDIPFPKSAFTSAQKLDKCLSSVKWQWLGTDLDARKLLVHVYAQAGANIPETRATRAQGLYIVNGRFCFVSNRMTLTSDATFEKKDAPIIWLPSKTTHADINLQPDLSREDLAFVKEHLPNVNEACAIWPMIGWFTAAVCKPWLENNHYRFPILNVYGTKGSGKTSLVEKLFMPLWGNTNAVSWNPRTTQFVIRTLCGSSNAVPVSFTEFRVEQNEMFGHMLRMSYDTGLDARGTAQQETIEYKLEAPLVVNGEDVLDEPAIRERLVIVRLDPNKVITGTKAHASFNALVHKMPVNFGGWIIQQTLKKLESGACALLLEQAEKDVDSLKLTLPDRVYKNHIVTRFGILLFCSITGLDIPSVDITIKESINQVGGTTGRTRNMADSFVEDLVNYVQGGGSRTFPIDYDKTNAVFYFQLKPAHDWWVAKRKREGRNVLEITAIRNQLAEAPYSAGSTITSAKVLMLGIDLRKAVKWELDVPNVLTYKEVVIQLP